MQLHTLKRSSKTRKKKVVGRGGKRGTYSGKGLKGQKSRAGKKIRPEIRDIIKKMPKKRGYKFSSRKTKPEVINIRDLSKLSDNAEITPKLLLEKGLISSGGFVKILGSGDIGDAKTVRGFHVSKSARLKIEKAGGKILEDLNEGKEIVVRPKRLPRPDKTEEKK